MCTDTQISSNLIKDILVDEEGINTPDKALAFSDASYVSHNPPGPSPQYYDHDFSAEGLRPYIKVNENDKGSIVAAMRKHHGNKTRAALSLGMTPRQLHYRIKKLQIEI
jgi:Nif-specific regulatory protein